MIYETPDEFIVNFYDRALDHLMTTYGEFAPETQAFASECGAALLSGDYRTACKVVARAMRDWSRHHGGVHVELGR